MASLGHVARRFFKHVLAKPLTQADIEFVRTLVSPDEESLFWRQRLGDQQHAVSTARRMLLTHAHERAVLRAALWHDIGKIDSDLGAVMRAFATVARLLRIPRPNRWHLYDNHGPIGARHLAAMDCEPLVVDFARLHPGSGPSIYSRAIWDALLRADDD